MRKSPRCRLSFSEWIADCGSSTPISRHGTPPSAIENGLTKPIEPPAPIIAASRPNPARSARRAASNAGPSGSVVHQRAVPLTLAVTRAPAGGRAVSRRASSAPARRSSMRGTVRSDSRARAASITWFEEPASGCASSAITVSAGRVQSRSHTE